MARMDGKLIGSIKWKPALGALGEHEWAHPVVDVLIGNMGNLGPGNPVWDGENMDVIAEGFAYLSHLTRYGAGGFAGDLQSEDRERRWKAQREREAKEREAKEREAKEQEEAKAKEVKKKKKNRTKKPRQFKTTRAPVRG